MSANEPQVLSLTNWATLLRQRLEGYREPTAMFGKHQRSVSRQLKTLSLEQPTPSPKTIAKFQEWRLDSIAERFDNRPGYEPIEAVAARLEHTPPPSGFVSGFFMGMREQPELGLPHTRRFADELDHLAQALLDQQWPGQEPSLAGYKQTLLDSPLVRREFWIEPGRNYDWLPLFEQATDWQEAWKLTHLIIFHLQISLLALWDAEYCADTFGRFTTIPLFLNLAPRLRPRPGDQQQAGLRRLNVRKSDVVDGPFSQLIDLLWCLLRFVQDGEWPQNFPTLVKMGEDLNCYQGDLANLRAGKPNLTADLFEALWPNNVRNKDGELMVEPLTLLAAAQLWDLINPSNQPLIPVDQCYMHAWHRYRYVLGTSHSQALSPTTGWPSYLNRGLETPAPG